MAAQQHDLGAVERQVAGLEARQLEQLVDEAPEPLRLREHDLERLRLGLLDAVQQVLQVRAERRDRRLQLVRDVRDERAPQPQETVWEQMNVPIARGLRGLIYVLWDLSQVDPSDLSMLLAGNGRLRIGFGEIEAPAGGDPADDQIEQAVNYAIAE